MSFGRDFEKDSQNCIILTREGIKTLSYSSLCLQTKYVDSKIHDDRVKVCGQNREIDTQTKFRTLKSLHNSTSFHIFILY